MNKFSTWIEAEFGRASALARHLGRSRSFVSAIKSGRKPMPAFLYPHVVEFSGGELSLSDLVPHVPLGAKRRK